MFRPTIRLDETADVSEVSAALHVRALKSGLDPASSHLLKTSFSEVVDALLENGRKLKAQGSQLNVTRKFEGSGYSVTLHFSVGRHLGFLERLQRFLRLG